MSDRSRDTVPSGWAVSTLADSVVPGRPRGNPTDFVGHPFVGLEHIEAHTTRMLGFVPAESMKSSGVVFEEGDVLYGRMRPYLNKVWLADRDGLCSGEFIVFPKTGALRGAFLKYRLNAQDFVSFTDHSTTGDRPRADFADFGKFPVLVPPLAEQARIADRIDELFTDLAAGVAALERVKRNLSRYRAAVLHAAVTGRLTEAWRKEHGPPKEPAPKLLGRILVERRKQWERRALAAYEAKGTQPPKSWKSRYQEPEPPKLPQDGTTLPELPEGWCWATALQLCSSVDNGNTPPPDEMYANAGDVPFIKVYNLTKRGVLDFSVKPTFVSKDTHRGRLARSVVYPGDVLMNIVGPPLGKVSLVPDEHPEWNINQAVVVFHCMGGLRNDYLVSCLLCDTVLSPITEKAKASAGQFNISVTMCRELLLPLPPESEQAAIVEAVNEKLSQIDALEAEVTRGLARAGRLRQAILKAAFEGKLVPQDPTDEPASALLERIRQQTAAAPKPKRSARKKTTRKAATR